LLATGRAATTTRQRRRTVGAVVYIGLVLALFVVIPPDGRGRSIEARRAAAQRRCRSSAGAVKWRSAYGSRVKRRLGAGAWLEQDGRGWRPRTGRPKPGYLTERQARRAMAVLVRTVEADAIRRHTKPAPTISGPTFRALAQAWLAHLVAVDDVKPSTLRNYRCKLVEPGTPHLRGSGCARGRIMAALGDKAPADITAADVSALLDAIAADGVSRRTVNRHREIVVAILNFGLRPDRRADWGLTENAAAAAPKRRVEQPARLEVFTVEQIEALARAAETGAWRTGRPYETPLAERQEREQDAQLGDLLRIAAYTGLRRGELIALRWRDVRWSERVLVVERALSDTVERSTKGRRVRYVPLADQTLAAFDRLSKRLNFVGADDYVFANVAGDRLDPSALRRRFIAARDAAGLPPLRFHDLRHTAGTLLTRVLDPVTAKDVLGHADLKTTERYLHAVRASRLADAATRAFAPSAPEDGNDAARAALRAAAAKLGPDEARRLLAGVG
jgi:integrase